MARFRLTIDTGNAAFHAEEDGRHEPGPEVARILRAVAAKVEDASQGGNLRDINGNHVGEYGYRDRGQIRQPGRGKERG